MSARARATLALCTAALGLCTAAPVSAEPILELQMTPAPGPSIPVTHSDERLAYELTVENAASPNPSLGTELSCKGTPAEGVEWFGKEPAPTFQYQWLRNGEPILGAGGSWPVAPAVPTHTVEAADAGKSLQCLVIATNDADGAGTTYAPIGAATVSRPPVVVEPVPSPVPPSGILRPGISGSETVGSFLTCTAPAGWSGTGITWSFQWLRNGESILGATTDTYTVQSADTEPPSILQCEATAKDAAGNEAVSISSVLRTEPRPPAPYNSPAEQDIPVISFANKTEGEITVEAELPPGTQALRALGGSQPEGFWTCVKAPPSPPQPSTARCTREDSLEPGDSYPPITLVAQVLSDAPDTLLTKAVAFGGGALDPASAEHEVIGIMPAVPFGFKVFETEVLDELGAELTQAGAHPFSVRADIEFNEHVRAERTSEAGFRAVNGFVRNVRTEAPPGFVGDPEALGEGAKCPSIADVIALPSNCPAASVVGRIALKIESGGTPGQFENQPIYAIEPERGTPAQFAFGVALLSPGFAYTLTPELRPEDGYAITLVAAPVQKTPELFEAKALLCGFGAKAEVDVSGETKFKSCRKADEPGALERPFLSLPTRCGDTESSTTDIYADTWEDPGSYAHAKYTLPAPTGCEELEFEPTLKARPTTNAADSPTGLDVDLHIPQNEDPEGTATAHLKKTVVMLPEGLVVNPSAANGLGACSPAQIGLGTNDPVRCPDSSKIGRVSVKTPVLDHPLPGALHIATPHENPFGSLLALYLVVDDPQSGIVVKLPGKVEADPNTGRLTTTFDENPEAPIEDVSLDIRGGASAPLRTPATCGRYATVSELTPWSAPDSGPPVSFKDSYQIRRGAGGARCASRESSLPNSPGFEAGSASLLAGHHSPFVVKLRRDDGTQSFSAVTLTPPPGLLAKLAGTAPCPDSALATAAAKPGRAEQASPSCPPASELGTLSAAAGAGPAPYNAPGKAYLAGPYKGAPLSFAFIAPAVAGPFDLGTVVVRAPAYVDPKTAQVTVKSDPLPQILQGIPLDVRSVTVAIDRPDFTLNPTSCDPMAVRGSLLSSLGQSAALESRFQVAECGRLGFKPRLSLRLKGKTKRGDYQALVATVRAKPGEANIASASVTMPRSAFLAQEHIRTVCTRVQFAADACPKGSVYGRAKAITSLLDQPLSGPVYLRSSDNKLPDLVVALKAAGPLPIEVELAGRTDSYKGALRNTFDLLPDAPVSKFTLELFGGKKGLIVNSRNLCGGTQRATVAMVAQNGKERSLRPVVGNGCKQKAGKKRP
jgi:hypothetical protein